jgi:3-isopropylmalate/(R)-2-methylmalate dehydratase small subunit
MKMKRFEAFTSVVTPLDRMNVDTDAIVPKQFLKRIERTGYGQFLFYDWRIKEGESVKEFPLNQPQYEGSQILISRANFGCGSSREHAPWALADYGFRVIIAPSFADIFYNNCFKNEILPIQLSEEQVDRLFRNVFQQQGFQLTVNLVSQKIIDPTGLEISFEIDSFRKSCLLNGYDDIAITLLHIDKIEEYESGMPQYYRK